MRKIRYVVFALLIASLAGVALIVQTPVTATPRLIQAARDLPTFRTSSP